MRSTYALVALAATVIAAPMPVDSDPKVFIKTLHHHGGVVRNGDPVTALADEASPSHYTKVDKPVAPLPVLEPVVPAHLSAPLAPIKPQAISSPAIEAKKPHSKRWCLWPVGTVCEERAWLDDKKTDMWGEPVNPKKEQPSHGHGHGPRSVEKSEEEEKLE